MSIPPRKQHTLLATSIAETPSCAARRAVAEKALQAYRDATGASSNAGADICDLITDLLLLAACSQPPIDPFRLTELAVTHFTAEAAGDITMPVRAALNVSVRRRTRDNDHDSSWSALHPQNTARKARTR